MFIKQQFETLEQNCIHLVNFKTMIYIMFRVYENISLFRQREGVIVSGAIKNPPLNFALISRIRM